MTSNDGNQAASSQNCHHVFIGIVWGVGYIVVAGIFFYFVRHQFSGYTNSVFDVIVYFPIVLMTSSGYKDLTPKSPLAKLFAIFFAFAGVVVFGVLLGQSAKILLPTQQDVHKIFDILLEDPEVQHWSKIKIRWKRPLLLFAVHMVIGSVLLALIGNMHISSAMRCVSSTFTTVLTDEKCFSTKDTRIFAVFWILLGMGTLGLMLYEITETLTQRSNWLFAKKNLHIYRPFKESPKFDSDGNMERDDLFKSMVKEWKSQDKNEDSNNKHGQRDAGKGQNSRIPDKLVQHVNKDFLKVFVFLAVYVNFSMIIFYAARDHIEKERKTNSFLDTLYFTFITMTSAGYGDIQPKNEPLALILASIFAILGLIFFEQLLTIGSTILVEQKYQLQGRLRSRELQYTPTTMELLPKLIKEKGKKVGIGFMVLMVVGTVFVIVSEKLNFIHALYCISITITSAGIDKCFSTERGRIFAIIWIIFGAICKYYVVFIIANIDIVIHEEQKEQPQEEKSKLEKQEPEGKRDEPVDPPRIFVVR
ncbi:hypothetical protein OSB04_003214 [Centaurea solstitialis]|uniref:Potassium channel domain-containing protein n=1 Tax=Centaurea solstitialis TaxID=347529 RepID=A0AA38UC88_9ASTR|nr:hypothetical protein OSB04_003214 [Centaurea solstitialis]